MVQVHSKKKKKKKMKSGLRFPFHAINNLFIVYRSSSLHFIFLILMKTNEIKRSEFCRLFWLGIPRMRSTNEKLEERFVSQFIDLHY